MFKPKPLDVATVFNKLKKIAGTSGTKCQAEKARLMQGLFVSAKGPEVKFVVRHVQGKMRMGLAEQTVFAALGRALAFTPIGGVPLDRSKKVSVEKMHELQTRYTEVV